MWEYSFYPTFLLSSHLLPFLQSWRNNLCCCLSFFNARFLPQCTATQLHNFCTCYADKCLINVYWVCLKPIAISDGHFSVVVFFADPPPPLPLKWWCSFMALSGILSWWYLPVNMPSNNITYCKNSTTMFPALALPLPWPTVFLAILIWLT